MCDLNRFFVLSFWLKGKLEAIQLQIILDIVIHFPLLWFTGWRFVVGLRERNIGGCLATLLIVVTNFDPIIFFENENDFGT